MNLRSTKKHKTRTPVLRGCPQKRALITKIVIIKPKKPNSAKRHIAKLRMSYGKKARAAIPGEYLSTKDRSLKKFSKVLIRGGRTRDIIGIRYKIILGVLDAEPLYTRITSRSKYGLKKKVF